MASAADTTFLRMRFPCWLVEFMLALGCDGWLDVSQVAGASGVRWVPLGWHSGHPFPGPRSRAEGLGVELLWGLNATAGVRALW